MKIEIKGRVQEYKSSHEGEMGYVNIELEGKDAKGKRLSGMLSFDNPPPELLRDAKFSDLVSVVIEFGVKP